MVRITISICIWNTRLYVSRMDFNVPSKNEAIRNGRRSNAIPNNYTNVNENRKSKRRNYTRMARKIFKYIQEPNNKMCKQL